MMIFNLILIMSCNQDKETNQIIDLEIIND